MKLILKFSLLLFLLFGCSKEEPIFSPDFPQTWALTKMKGVGFVHEAPFLPWVDAYVFREDGRFGKFRIQEGDTIKIEGHFKTGTKENGLNVYELTYDEESPIIENCSNTNTETLAAHVGYISLGTLLCDGAGFIFTQL